METIFNAVREFVSDPVNDAMVVLILFLYNAVIKYRLHFRAFNVWDPKTNPHGGDSSQSKKICRVYRKNKSCIPEKIEDFCIMVNRIKFRHEIKVELYSIDGHDLHLDRVWMKKDDLTPYERWTKVVKCTPVASPDKHGLAFTTDSAAFVSAVQPMACSTPGDSARLAFASMENYEMIRIAKENLTEEHVVEKRLKRLKEDQSFIARHFKRAALSYWHAYGHLFPGKWFLPHYQYSPATHDMIVI